MQFLLDCFPTKTPEELSLYLDQEQDIGKIINCILSEDYIDSIFTPEIDEERDLKIAYLMDLFPSMDSVFVQYFAEVVDCEGLEELGEWVLEYMETRKEPKKKVLRKIGIGVNFDGFEEHQPPKEDFFDSYASAVTHNITSPTEEAVPHSLLIPSFTTDRQPKTAQQHTLKYAQELRERALKYHNLRVEKYRRAAEAFGKGRLGSVVASHYSHEGSILTENVNSCNQKAAEIIFSLNNSNGTRSVVDLHGLHVKESIQYLSDFMQMNTPPYTIITGKGNHSKDFTPRILPSVIQYLRRKGVKFTLQSDNNIHVADTQ